LHITGRRLAIGPTSQTQFETMNDTINDKQSTEDGGAVGKPAVMRRFSVSLVFQEQRGDRLQTALRVIHLEARSEAEALGEAVEELWSDELKDYRLVVKVVLPFSAA